MEDFLVFFAVLLIVIVVFRDNKWIRPLRRFLTGIVVFFMLVFSSSILGFVIGYKYFARIEDISIPFEVVFGENQNLIGDDLSKVLDLVYLDKVRENIFISTLCGFVLGVLLFFVYRIFLRYRPKSLEEISERLEKLKQMRDSGSITDAEYEQMKAKVLK